jgi:hypothetical protein
MTINEVLMDKYLGRTFHTYDVEHFKFNGKKISYIELVYDDNAYWIKLILDSTTEIFVGPNQKII